LSYAQRDQISRKQHIIHPGAGTKILFLDRLAGIQFLIFRIILSANKLQFILYLYYSSRSSVVKRILYALIKQFAKKVLLINVSEYNNSFILFSTNVSLGKYKRFANPYQITFE